MLTKFILQFLGGPPPPPPPPVGGSGPPGGAGGSKRPPPPPSRDNKPSSLPTVSEGRGDLLASIRAGIQLKSVDSGSSGGGAAPTDNLVEPGGMAGALRRALAARSDAIHSGE